MIKKWIKEEENLVYNGYRRVLRKKFLMPNGKVEEYDIFSAKDYVAIIALTPQKEIILTRQFRPGTEEIFDEIPSGMIDGNEIPREAGERELLEETGYTGSFTEVGRAPLAAYENIHGYCITAVNCNKIREPCLDEDEFLETRLCSLTRFRQLLRDGRSLNIHLAYMGLDYLRLL
ncbi:NUDIX hydrolase [Candidatus Pacearchaeota archaeon]|nr:NUDIX hydrolase [Candidatus Pacearchaeota archaeon]